MKNAKNELAAIGNLWEKGDKSRIYFNAKTVSAKLGLEYDTYKSGAICSASLNGETISHSRANRIFRTLDGAYYDLVSGKCCTGRNGELDAEIMEALIALVADMLADDPVVETAETAETAETEMWEMTDGFDSTGLPADYDLCRRVAEDFGCSNVRRWVDRILADSVSGNEILVARLLTA